jgi:succinate dehydrogenase / fumarate reductase, cytochrome b subunit
MRALLEFYNSSVGKKLIVALTGLFLISFLIIHLFGNLLILRHDGGEVFDAYAEALPQIVVIRIIEIGLFLILLLHVISGAFTWLLNKQARGSAAYDLQKKSETSAISSRTMLLSGSIVYIFLVIHMRQFWFTSRYEAGEHFSMYEVVRSTFSDPVYSVFYLIALFLLGFHLKHGFQSAFQTFGLRNKKYERLIEWAGALFWLCLPIAYAAIPLYILLNL